VYYLSVGELAKAQMIAADMADMDPESRTDVRNDLLLQAPPHFWEIVDRGRNLHYLADDERAYLDRFLALDGDR
jgi:hypothetical protein